MPLWPLLRSGVVLLIWPHCFVVSRPFCHCFRWPLLVPTPEDRKPATTRGKCIIYTFILNGNHGTTETLSKHFTRIFDSDEPKDLNVLISFKGRYI